MEEEAPSPEALLKFFEQLKDLSPEEREQLRQEVLSRAGIVPPEPPSKPPTSEFYLLVTLLFIVTLMFVAQYTDQSFPVQLVVLHLHERFIVVFFGYKLYKSLKERERKRDEKKKLKQQKKKK